MDNNIQMHMTCLRIVQEANTLLESMKQVNCVFVHLCEKHMNGILTVLSLVLPPMLLKHMLLSKCPSIWDHTAVH